MSLFRQQQQARNNIRQLLTGKYSSARSNLLLVIIFTAINVALISFGKDTYFLFSATVPYLLAYMGAGEAGKLGDIGYEPSFDPAVGQILFYVCLACAVVILLVYLVLWILARKPRGVVMIIALVIFGLDTAYMVMTFGLSLDMIIDYLFHGWVILSLISGISAARKLRELPEEPIEIESFSDKSDSFDQLGDNQ